MAGGVALRRQPRGEPDLHADPVRDAKPAAGCGGYSDRLGDNHLVSGRRLAALQMGRRGSGAVFRLGVAGDRFAIVDYLDELGEALSDAFRHAYSRRTFRLQRLHVPSCSWDRARSLATFLSIIR